MTGWEQVCRQVAEQVQMKTIRGKSEDVNQDEESTDIIPGEYEQHEAAWGFISNRTVVVEIQRERKNKD